MSAIKTARNFFGEFDLFTASPTLRSNNQPYMSNFCTGIFSFLIFVLFSYIFIFNAVGVIRLEKIQAIQTEQAVPDFRASAEELFFGINIDFLTFQEIQKFFRVSIYSLQGDQEKQFEIQRCTQDQWKALGQNYAKYFEQSRLEDFYCPAENQNMKLQKTWISTNPQSINIMIAPCDTNRTTCASASEKDAKFASVMAKYGYFQVYVYFMDRALSPQNQAPLQYYLNVKTTFAFRPSVGSIGKIFLGTYNIQTDTSILPYEQVKTIKGTYLESFSSVSFQRSPNSTDEIYSRVSFFMSPQQKNLKRQVGKLDDMLSYVGGLFSTLIVFFAFFLMSYNQYWYELRIAENMFNYDEKGKKIREHDLNIWKYIKYSIFDWFDTLFCHELGWEDCKQIHKARQQVNSQIDVTSLFRKIQNIQMTLNYVLSEQAKDCLSLSQHQSILEVKRSRQIAEYYQAIAQGQQTLTLQDIKQNQNSINFALQVTVSGIKAGGKKKNNLNSSLAQLITSRQSEMKNVDKLFELASKQFPQIIEQVDNIELSEELLEVQKSLSTSLSKLSKQQKQNICLKIPFKILHRLRKRTEEYQNSSKILEQ